MGKMQLFRRATGVALAAWLLLTMSVSCSSERAELEQTRKAADVLSRAWVEEGTFKKIRPLQPNAPRIVKFEGGSLEDGYALLLVNNNAAFWLKDDKLHVVNDAARELLPRYPVAPPTITYEAVRAVAR